MIPTMVSRICSKALIALAIGTLVQMAAHAQTTFTPPAVAPVPNPCPRAAAGSPVINPVALFSSHGILSVISLIKPERMPRVAPCFCFMTPSGLENPTLHVSPGRSPGYYDHQQYASRHESDGTEST